MSLCSPDDAVLQPTGDDVDGHALGLVGEGHGADDLSAVDVTDQVAVHRPQAQVAATAHWIQRIMCHNSDRGVRHTRVSLEE